MMTNDEMFKIGYNFLTFILIVEGIYLIFEVYTKGYTNKSFFYIGFMLLTKISQINTILYFNRLEGK